MVSKNIPICIKGGICIVRSVIHKIRLKNGSIYDGKPKFMCNNCGRQFIKNPTKKVIPKETWDLVDKLLLEKGSP